MAVNYGDFSGIGGGRCLGSKNELNGSCCWRIGDIVTVGSKEGGENVLSRATTSCTSCTQAGKLKPSLWISGRSSQDFFEGQGGSISSQSQQMIL